MRIISILIMTFALLGTTMAQVTVTGTVTDESGYPLPGVNVTVQGTTIGVVSDGNGKYSINVPGRESVLLFSFVGYTTVDYVVGDNRVIDAKLFESAQEMEEVVVVGYGTVRKSDLTGSVVSISSDKFKNLPQTGVTQILQGKAAGVNIISTRGDGEANIRIRGTSSLFKSSEPLWVVDGVIGAPQPNFHDIQSIEILKDASSTAIYGSQGANGVILVTSKKPAEGTARVTLDSRLTWNTFRRTPDLLDAKEYAEAYQYVRGENAAMAPYLNGTSQGVDWFDLMTQTGFSQSYNLSVSGGSPKTKYGISAWVGDTKQQIITAKSRSYNARATISTDITPWLNLSGWLHGSRSESHNGVGYGEMDQILEYSPANELMNENGIYNSDRWGSISMASPYAGKVASYNDVQSNDLRGLAELRIKLPIDGLTFSSQGMYTHNNSLRHQIDKSIRYTGVQNEAYHQMNQSWRLRNINNLTYQKQFGEHRLTAMAVLETTKYEYSRVRATSRQFNDEDKLGYWVVGKGTVTAEEEYSNSGMVSAFGRIIYSFKNRYSFTGTYRADAPSQFRGDNKWGYFPSAGVSWNISEEDFFNKDMIQQLKLRASYGVTGNHGIGAYATIPNLVNWSTNYGTSSQYFGWWDYSFVNPNVTWEKTAQYNVGVDVSLLNQRVNVTTDWFLKKTTDLLFREPLPYFSGTGGGIVWINQGEINNSGWELTINAWPVRTRDFAWESTFTASYLKSKIIDLGGKDKLYPDPSRGSLFAGNLFILELDGPMGCFDLQRFAGFDDQGNTLHYKYDENGNVSGTTTLNDPANKRSLPNKSSFPKWNFGWNNSLTYKNWDLNVFLRFTGNYYRLNVSRYVQSCMVGASRFISSAEGYYLSWDRVADKSKAEFASLTSSDNQYVPGSTQWLENGKFLRCQNVSLGYLLPKSTTRFADVHLSFSVQNLFVLTKYRGLDPETVSSVDNDANTGTFDTTHGLDRGSLPMPRAFSFIVRLEF